MHSSTSSYIVLQSLFRQQHLSDLAEFRQLLKGVLESIGLPADAVSDEEVENFVRGTGSVGIVKGSSLHAGKAQSKLLGKAIGRRPFDECERS